MGKYHGEGCTALEFYFSRVPNDPEDNTVFPYRSCLQAKADHTIKLPTKTLSQTYAVEAFKADTQTRKACLRDTRAPLETRPTMAAQE